MVAYTERPLPGPIPYTDKTPWRIVLHTTESSSTTTYNNGAVAPQLTVWVQKRQTWKHYDYLKYAGKALKHPSGTPATNTTRAVQIEVIGFCDDHQIAHPLHISHWTAGDYAYLASVLRQVAADTGCKLVSTVKWKGYGLGITPNTSAGENNGVRMSDTRWASYEGVCGHQHVPNNTHGDPGNLNIKALLPAPTPAPTKGKKMFRLIQPDGPGHAIYVTDGMTIRWIQGGLDALDYYQALLDAYGFDSEVHAHNANSPIQAYGVLIGPDAPGSVIKWEGTS